MTDPTPKPDDFSWERWLFDGLKALRRMLFRYDFGLPDDFWYHLERAAHELLTAGRILVKTLLQRRRGRQSDAPRGEIEIEWE
ncbi:MAG: hypothetical protein HUU23_11705 [Caldilineales bacterium]|nr:hypothetical protein [Caldilineales bacterium]